MDGLTSRRIIAFGEDGQARISPLPGEYALLGGRALAGKLAESLGDGDALIFVPGLLANARMLPAGRCCVACRHGTSGFSYSSAGGLAARALASQGIAALVLQCAPDRCGNMVLSVHGGNAEMLPSLHDGRSVSSALSALRSAFPHSSAIATSGPAGRMGLAIGGLVFGSDGSSAVSRAGGGSGAVLCGMGIQSVIMTEGRAASSPLAEEKEKEMLRILLRPPLPSSSRCTACTPHCAVQPKQGAARSAGKWPGYAENWAAGDEAQDILNQRRYVSFCDEFGADAFALAQILADARAEGLLDGYDAARLLDVLEPLLEGEGDPFVMKILERDLPPGKRSGAGRWKHFLDSLGLCSAAAAALDHDGDQRDAFASAAVAALGLDDRSLDTLYGNMG